MRRAEVAGGVAVALTPLQEDERSAMVLDRAAVLRVVSALRQYRALVVRVAALPSGDRVPFMDDEISTIEGITDEEDDGPESPRLPPEPAFDLAAWQRQWLAENPHLGGK